MSTEKQRELDKSAVEMRLYRQDAAWRPRTIDEDKRTVELVWTTGAAVQRFGPRADGSYGRYVELLEVSDEAVDLSRLRAGAPLLDTHAGYSIRSQIGVVEAARVVDGVGIATVRFSARDDVEPIWRDVVAGVIRNVSVGYLTLARKESERKGQADPMVTVTRWQPFELSLVPVPADAAAQVRGIDPYSPVQPMAADPAQHRSREMPEEVIDQTAGEQSAADTAAVTQKRNKPKPDEAALREAALAEERQRAAEITKLCQRHGLQAMAVDLIAGGVALDTARARILDTIAASAEEPRITSHVRVGSAGLDEREKFLRGASDWLVQRSAQRSAIEAREQRQVDPGEFRGMTLLDLAKESLRRSGVETRGLDPMRIAGLALRYGPAQQAGDFPVLLENTMNKTLLASYSTTPVTYNRWCRIGTVSDFRAHPRYRTGLIGSLGTVRDNGEFNYLNVPDGKKESITADTVGNLLAVTRRTIVNDDMNALSLLPQDLGRAAAVTVENAAIALLVSASFAGPTLNEDSKAVFHADHGNIASTSAAPSVDSFNAARVAMARRMDVAGKDYLQIVPTVWLGPPELRATAMVVNDNQYDPSVSNKFQVANSVRGMFADIVDTPRLSGTRWYAFAPPAQASAFEVAFLNGQTEPFLDQEETFNVDGLSWKVRLDFGVAAIDYRGAYTNPGA